MRLPSARTLILVTLALKLVLLAARYPSRPQSVLWIDSGTYVRPALALLKSGSFSPSPEQAPEPEINRTPGYPLLIAALYGAFGERPWLLSVAGAFFSAGTALALFSLARRLFDDRAATCAVLLLSLDFGTFWRSLDVLSDTPFTCLLVVGLLLAVRSLDSDGPRDALLAGLALASATLVRPISLYLLAALVLFLLLAGGRPSRVSRARAAAFALPCVLLVGGWAARNRVRAGAFTVSPLPSSWLLFYFASGVQAQVDGLSIPAEQEKLGNWERHFRSGGASESEVFGTTRYADLYPETSRLSYLELCRRWRTRAFEILRAHPYLTAREMAIYEGTLLFQPPTLLFGFQYGLYWPVPALSALFHDLRFGAMLGRLASEHPVVFAFSIVTLLQLALLYVLALRGLAEARPFDRRHIPLLVTLVYLVLVSAGSQVCDDRFRLPIVPIAALYGGFALSHLLRSPAR
jgi:4-amino-4-deoxy-L-arabinose transferase-like glycosyltransferase